MIQKPFFSIIIPTLNEELFVPSLLKCLSKQTYTNFEIIHVDGNSKDKTVEKVSSFNKVKSLIVKEKNVCLQRNFGAKKASGKWLIFIDADVLIHKNYLNMIYSFIKANKVDIFSTFYKPDDNNLSYRALMFFSSLGMYFSQFFKKPLVSEAVFVINKNKFFKLKGFDEKLKISEGADLIKRAKKQGFIFKFLLYPRYTFSMRRVKQQGIIKTIKTNLLIVLNMIIGKKITNDKLKDLYPMYGGEKYP